jgi:SnoaL-like domain
MSKATAAPPEAPSPAAQAWVEMFAEGWRAPADADSFADHFIPWLHPEIRLLQPQMPVLVGYEAFREGFVRPMFETFPGLHGEVGGWAARGDLLYIEVILRGRLGGRPIEFTSCDRITLRDEKAIERYAYSDPTPVLQAGLVNPRAWGPLARFQRHQLRNRRRFR